MARYSSCGDDGCQVREFKEMVKALHKEGIEVILDVVYNHTCEGNEKGPSLSWKGIDNTTYYRLMEGDGRHYMDYTGTGNTLNMMNPQVLKMVMDSLRYWVLEMHIDGFRFDLASTLARELHDVSKLSSFFDVDSPGPHFAGRCKADRGAVGCGRGRLPGRQLSQCCGPSGTASIATRYVDSGRVKKALLSDFAYRLTGSSDLYQSRWTQALCLHQLHHGARWLYALTDLVSLQRQSIMKQTATTIQRRRERQRQHGTWAPKARRMIAAINEMRERQTRNFLATLILSQGVPMLCGGDEVGSFAAWQQQRLLPGQRDYLVRLEA